MQNEATKKKTVSIELYPSEVEEMQKKGIEVKLRRYAEEDNNQAKTWFLESVLHAIEIIAEDGDEYRIKEEHSLQTVCNLAVMGKAILKTIDAEVLDNISNQLKETATA